MGADNTLQLVLDATTNVLTAIYTPPSAPEGANAPPAAPSEGESAEASDTVIAAPLAATLPSWDTLAAL
ncbi:DUF342 domain-containing protein, partial [Achromobacter xylosoxidans]|nr:DUF342 domain-containing protein [Achromobacter xylosoxidans]